MGDNTTIGNENSSMLSQEQVDTMAQYFEFFVTFAGVLIVIPNIVSIIVIGKSRKMPFQIKSLAINLAVTDCITGSFLIIYRWGIYINVFTCGVIVCTICTVVSVSLITITSFALDHALALYFSLKYLRFISQSRMNMYCVLTWVLGILVSFANFSDLFKQYHRCEYSSLVGKSGQSISNYSILPFYITNFVMYIYVLKVVKQRSKWRNSQSNQTLRIILKQQKRTMAKVFVITGLYFVMITPRFIYNFIFVYGDVNSLKTFKYISSLVILCNSIVNPFLFVYRFKDCRFTFCRLFFFWNKELREKYTNRLSLIVPDYRPEDQQRQERSPHIRTITVQQSSRNAVHPLQGFDKKGIFR